MFRKRGSILGGLSQIMYLRSPLTVVFLNSGALQMTEWKYTSWGRITLFEYIRRVRGRLSHPRTQNSRKRRLKITHWEPGNPVRFIYQTSIPTANLFYECIVSKRGCTEKRSCLWRLWRHQVLGAFPWHEKFGPSLPSKAPDQPQWAESFDPCNDIKQLDTT